MIAISAIGIVICIALLIVSSFRNISTVLIAALGAGIVGLLGGLGFVEAIVGPYMASVSDFIKGWLIVFALGGLLGGLYSKSGAAWRIGNVLVRKASPSIALLAFVLFGAILVYGGINAPVAIFILLPLARIIFPKAGIPWYLFPGVAAFATCTFAMYLPGSLSVVNLIGVEQMSEVSGTSIPTTAAPVEGVVGSIFLLVVGFLYLLWEVKKGRNRISEETPEKYLDTAEVYDDAEMDKNAPSFIISIIPLLVTLILVDVIQVHVLLGFSIGCLSALILFWNKISDKIKVISSSFNDGLLPCILVAAVSGLGGVISATPAFDVIRNAIMELPLGGLVKVALSTTLIAGICASGSGGLRMALSLLGKEFLAMGFPPTIIARVAAIASGGLDSMPWNGSIVMIHSLSGVSIKTGYRHVFVLTCLLPILASLVAAFTYTIIH